MELPDVEEYAKSNNDYFIQTYPDWINLNKVIYNFLSGSVSCFFRVKKPLHKSQAILASKVLNHILSIEVLLKRGLFLDAALLTRNNLETALLGTWFLMSQDEEPSEKWLTGKQYRPAYVRDKLKNIRPKLIRGQFLATYRDSDEENRKIYSFLSNVTHANVDSLILSKRESKGEEFEIEIGGADYSKNLRVHKDIVLLIQEVNAIAIFRYTMLVSHILSIDYATHKKNEFDEIKTLMSKAASAGKSRLWSGILD